MREKFVDTTERIIQYKMHQFLTFETTDYYIYMCQHSSHFRFVTARRQEDKLQKPLNSLFIPSRVSARLTYINHLIACTYGDSEDYNSTDFVLSPTKSHMYLTSLWWNASIIYIFSKAYFDFDFIQCAWTRTQEQLVNIDLEDYNSTGLILSSKKSQIYLTFL